MSDNDPLPAVEVSAEKPKPAPEAAQPPAKPPAAAPKQPDHPFDELTLLVAGQRFTGWQDVRITRGIEHFPSDATIRVSEGYPDKDKLLALDPGQTCQVLIGNDVVITGYLDVYAGSLGVSPRGFSASHPVGIRIRSQTEDLVDCQAGVTEGRETAGTMTFSSSSFLTLANDLCAPFGITATAPDGDGEPLISVGDGIPQFTIALGQTVYDVLEPIARWRRLLLLDGTDGNLVLAKAGTIKAGSAFTIPGSGSGAGVNFSKNGRFTVYLPALQNIDSGLAVSAALAMPSANYFTPIKDEAAFKGQPRRDGKPRYRPRAVVSEQGFDGINLAENRAKWQKARDYGRSQAVTVEVPLWRDSAKKLWTPNTLAEVNIPSLKLSKLTWLISEVTYTRNERGTRSIVTLMPPEAFAPEPSLFTPFDPQISQALADDVRKKAVTTPGNPSFNPRLNEPTGGI